MSSLETEKIPAPVAVGVGPAGFFTDAHGSAPVRAEIFGLERSEIHARHLAAHTRASHVVPGRPLLKQFLCNRRSLLHAYREISAAYRRKEAFGPDAEWLLDNFHIVSEALFEVQTDLPHGYYRLLPKIAAGPLRGLPRVYAVAVEMVAHGDSSLDETHLARFVNAFQTVAPLTIGELWAIPIMLRLVLVDNLRRLAEQILHARGHRQNAEAWAARHLAVTPGAAAPLALPAPVVGRHETGALPDSFVVQLLDWMHEQGAAVTRGLEWLESYLQKWDLTTEKVLRRERQRQAANQISIGNCVTSLRLLSALDWPAFFEKTSLVEARLRDDPAGVYSLQDFATRDRYRQVVEKLSRGSRCDEVEVVNKAIGLAANAARSGDRAITTPLPVAARSGDRAITTPLPVAARSPDRAAGPRNHVGYYLIGDGKAELENQLHYRPTLRDRFLNFLLGHPQLVYFGGVASVLLFLLAAFATCYAGLLQLTVAGGLGHGLLVSLSPCLLVFALPASDVAVSLVNYCVGWLTPPRVLPKFLFKDGIPEDCATFVVMPALLIRPRSAAALLERLEVHYLANPDPRLRFALLTDFADAPAEQMPEDEAYLRSALEGVRELNDRYCAGGSDRFFVFHRRRLWNPVQGCWMGWERKRGKLMEFNRLLRGARDASYLTTWDAVLARAPELATTPIRYVITLDADTRLPHDAAKRLVAALAHPLNRPVFDPAQRRVVSGYGVLQPRVSLTMTGVRKSRFARVFGGSAGLDPYTMAVSNVYQDLFGVGTFTGKGVYDVDAFEQAVGGTFPENHILSHDLIEGAYARCGLVTDIELLDDFPASYLVFARREHRWARGDWQILPWLFPRVPTGVARSGDRGTTGDRAAANPLPAVERWKIFDNLRRTLAPPALILLLILGWTVLPGSPWFWTAAALAVAAWPLILQLSSVPSRAAGVLGQVLQAAREPRESIIPSGLGNTTAQVLLSVAFLPEQAGLLVDAIVRTLYRVFVGRHRLLEWETAAAAERRLGGDLGTFLRILWLPPVPGGSRLAVILGFFRRDALGAAAPLLVAWFACPFVAFWVSKPPPVEEPELNEQERRLLRRLARKTWSFFETFVTEDDNWLPPDNYQEDPKAAVAHRTSPTNMGLYLVSSLAAHDFGYLSYPAFLGRLEKTFTTFDRLERAHGHFYNWYETTTLKALPPIYLSTVDSGYLLGCLLTLKQGLREKAAEPIPNPAIRTGLEDALELAAEALSALEAPAESADGLASLVGLMERLRPLMEEAPADLLALDDWLRRLNAAAAELVEQITTFGKEIDEEPGELQRWARCFASLVRERREELAGLAPWMEALRAMCALWPGQETTLVSGLPTGDQSGRLGQETGPQQGTAPQPGDPAAPAGWQALRKLLTQPLSVAVLHARVESIQTDLAALAQSWPDAEGRQLLARLGEAVGNSTASDLHGRWRSLAERAETFANQMDFKILYSEDRHLFAVGYNLSAGRLDGSHYDLLASESALTSFLAVARGDVPKKHWFQLGRPLTRAAGRITLLSWGGTMFEYLMPRLMLPGLPETLLDESRRGAVARQMEYGRQCGTPWGVSESAFSVVDAELNYQYQAFGVPGLGLKRGLGKDLVVAPYAAVMAVMVQPRLAIHNFQRLAAEGAEGAYGFYESIDYTRERLQPKQRCVVVKCFMAHHQGMGLTALANCLLNDLMPRRFRAEPMVRAAELLLQECMAPEAPLVQPHGDEASVRPAASESQHPMSRRITTPYTVQPRTHLLSSGQYSVMVTNAGGSRAVWRSLDVSRWREDRTRDDWGQFCYIRDLHTGVVWSAGHQPVCRDADDFEVIYSTDKAEFRRLDGAIETHMEVTASPESHAEVRRLTLTNHDSRPHELELTSYLEVVLSPHAADMAHPAFNKLFLETESALGGAALLCRRRPRAHDQRPIWGVHVLAVDGPVVGALQFETDRARFLGRGRTTAGPAAMDPGAALSGTTGPVLDPIFSLRCRVRVEGESLVKVAFTTTAGDTREEALALADRYHDMLGVTRAFEMAWAHSQVELRQMHMSAQEAHLYQRLAAHVIFAGPALRAPQDILRANEQGQPALWRYGVSGDNPIILVRVGEAAHLALARQMLAAHNYWRHKGLEADLVILNEDQSGYFDDLQNQLQGLVRASEDRGQVDKPGGVFVRKASQMSHEDRLLFQAAARCLLAGNRGSLATQMDRLERGAGPAPRPPRPSRRRGAEAGPRTDPPAVTSGPTTKDLLFDNGIGGFTPDGREYAIRLAARSGDRAATGARPEFPPAPWSNVVANPSFGFLVTERGGGYTWAGNNSQLNRLTPWSNDAASDPPGEVVYLRDEATGEIWTPTALAPRGPAPYGVRHGQGYTLFTHSGRGLDHELLLFVPPTDPVKVIRLKVHNVGRRPRRLSAAFFAVWVLGTVRDESAMRVVTEMDAETGALLARNRFNADFSTAVAFADVNARPRTWTCDRTEFLGRNGSTAAPAVLLGNVTEAGPRRWGETAGAPASTRARRCKLPSTSHPAKKGRLFSCLGKRPTSTKFDG